jgi:hypothetical protein
MTALAKLEHNCLLFFGQSRGDFEWCACCPRLLVVNGMRFNQLVHSRQVDTL